MSEQHRLMWDLPLEFCMDLDFKEDELCDTVTATLLLGLPAIRLSYFSRIHGSQEFTLMALPFNLEILL